MEQQDSHGEARKTAEEQHEHQNDHESQNISTTKQLDDSYTTQHQEQEQRQAQQRHEEQASRSTEDEAKNQQHHEQQQQEYHHHEVEDQQHHDLQQPEHHHHQQQQHTTHYGNPLDSFSALKPQMYSQHPQQLLPQPLEPPLQQYHQLHQHAYQPMMMSIGMHPHQGLHHHPAYHGDPTANTLAALGSPLLMPGAHHMTTASNPAVIQSPGGISKRKMEYAGQLTTLTPDDQSSSDAKKKKRMKCTQACDACRKGKCKCSLERPCERCLRKGIPCADTPPKKRGPKPSVIVNNNNNPNNNSPVPSQPVAVVPGIVNSASQLDHQHRLASLNAASLMQPHLQQRNDYLYFMPQASPSAAAAAVASPRYQPGAHHPHPMSVAAMTTSNTGYLPFNHHLYTPNPILGGVGSDAASTFSFPPIHHQPQQQHQHHNQHHQLVADSSASAVPTSVAKGEERHQPHSSHDSSNDDHHHLTEGGASDDNEQQRQQHHADTNNNNNNDHYDASTAERSSTTEGSRPNVAAVASTERGDL